MVVVVVEAVVGIVVASSQNPQVSGQLLYMYPTYVSVQYPRPFQ